MSGVIPSTEFNDQIVRVVKQVLREERGTQPRTGDTQRTSVAWQWAIANTSIPAATNGLTDPGTGTIELLTMDQDQDLSRSGVTYTGVNRAEGVSIEKDTLLIVARFKGERVVIWADCAALASPPT